MCVPIIAAVKLRLRSQVPELTQQMFDAKNMRPDEHVRAGLDLTDRLHWCSLDLRKIEILLHPLYRVHVSLPFLRRTITCWFGLNPRVAVVTYLVRQACTMTTTMADGRCQLLLL